MTQETRLTLGRNQLHANEGFSFIRVSLREPQPALGPGAIDRRLFAVEFELPLRDATVPVQQVWERAEVLARRLINQDVLRELLNVLDGHL